MHLIQEAFNNRNIEFEYFKDTQALVEALKEEIESHHTVGIGNSKTLKKYQISELANQLGKTVYDKTFADTKEAITVLKKKALTAELYITGSNAITEEGKIVNVDHSGNRVAAMTYGPDRVLIVVGKNKLVTDEQAAIKRVLKHATPLNAQRAGIVSPCSEGQSCKLCTQAVRVCNYLSIIRGQHVKGRMKVMMIDEIVGF